MFSVVFMVTTAGLTRATISGITEESVTAADDAAAALVPEATSTGFDMTPELDKKANIVKAPKIKYAASLTLNRILDFPTLRTSIIRFYPRITHRSGRSRRLEPHLLLPAAIRA